MDFSEIINYPYPDTAVENDITECLNSGKYLPSYAFHVQQYLTKRINHFAPYVNDAKYQAHFVFMQDFNLQNPEPFIVQTLKVKKPIRKKYLAEKLKKDIPANMAGSYVFSVPGDDDKIHIIVALGYHDNPLMSVYDGIKAFMHTMQRRKIYAEYFENINRQRWMWRDGGMNDNRLEQMLKATNFNYEKVSKIYQTYSTVQADVGAGAYLLIKAMQNGSPEIISKVEDFVLSHAAASSSGLIDNNNGTAACAFPVMQKMINLIKQNGVFVYVDAQGWVNWETLYNHTLAETKNIGYTPHMMIDANKKQGALLKSLNKQYPDRKQLLNILKWTPEVKTDKILQDFISAQEFSLQHPLPDNNLQSFYSSLANPEMRKTAVGDKKFNSLSNIKQYRQALESKHYSY